MSKKQEPNYIEKYTERGLWRKLKRYGAAAGREVVRPVLILFYTLQKPEVPAWAKTVIVAALGYFIFPLDAIPDLTPLAGYSDDLGALTAALAMVATYVDKDVRKRASDKLKDWFD